MAEVGGDPAANGGSGAPAQWAGLSEQNRGFVATKGFKNEDAVVQAYRELESFRGVPAERLLKLPDKDDSPEWEAIHRRLGKPEKAEEYGIEGADAELLAEAHKAGLTKKQVQQLAAHLAGRSKSSGEKAETERVAQQQLEEQELRKEWGPEFESNVNHGKEVYQRAAKAVGWESPEAMAKDFEAIEGQIGTKKLLKLMAFMGRGTAPHGFVEGEATPASTAFGSSTPAAAMQKFRELSTSKDFMARYHGGDLAAISEYDRWAKLAAPGFRAGGPQS